MLGLSEAGWVAIIVAAIGAFAAVVSSAIGLANRKEVKEARSDVHAARHELSAVANTNQLDHGHVALALSQLMTKVDEHHARTGQRFERLGERIGELAHRQEQTNERQDKTNERIDNVNKRIDSVIVAQQDHLAYHLTGNQQSDR